MRYGWIIILILLPTPFIADANANSSFSVFPSTYDLGYLPDNFSKSITEVGQFNVTNFDEVDSLDLRVSISNIPQGVYLSIPSTVTVPPKSTVPIEFVLDIPPVPGTFIIVVRVAPQVGGGETGSQALPVFEGKIRYVVGGSGIRGFQIESHAPGSPFNTAIVLHNSNPFGTIADLSLEIYDSNNDSVALLEKKGIVLQPMNLSTLEEIVLTTTMVIPDITSTGILHGLLSASFQNSTAGYLRRENVTSHFISGVSKPFIQTEILSPDENGKEYATASVSASNSGELPYSLEVTFTITDSNGKVVNSYSVVERVENKLEILQPLILEKTGSYEITIRGVAGNSEFMNQRRLEIGGYANSNGNEVTNIASNILHTDDITARLLIYFILVLIALILLGLLAIIVKKLRSKDEYSSPGLPFVQTSHGQVIQSMNRAMTSAPPKIRAVPPVPTSEVRLSKLHIFLTSGEALVTYDFRHKTLTDLTEISLSEIIYAMEKINMGVLKFIPLRKNDDLTIYIHVIDGIGFGVELADPSKYQELQGADNLVKSLERFHMIYGEKLSMGLVDLTSDNFKKAFRF